MKVVVDPDMCEGHSKCQMAAPEVFRFSETDEVSVVLLDEIPPELKDKVDRAIRLCPRQAISWVAQPES